MVRNSVTMPSSLIILMLGFVLTVEGFSPTTGFSSALGKGTKLYSKKDAEEPSYSSFSVGTFVEFEEKRRGHVGKISKLEHKTSGKPRYQIIDSNGKSYDVPDKAVTFAINPPNSPGAASKLFDEFLAAHDASEEKVQSQLDISNELLEMAWEESAETEGDHVLSPSSLVELIHSHAASSIEKYLAWKLLRTDLAHVFFKEIKDHGRVVSFKAKTRKAVDAAKQTFCNSHQNSDLCLV